MGDASRDEDGSPRTHVNHAIDEAKPQRALEYVPRLIVRVMDMQCGGPTPAALVSTVEKA